MPVSDDEIERRLRAKESYRRIRKATGASYDQISKASKKLKAAAPAGDLEWDEKGDAATVTARTAELVRTEADAVRVCGVDLTRWAVDRLTVKTYQMAHKDDRTGAAVVTQMFAVTLHLKRRHPRPVQDAAEALWKRFVDASPRVRPKYRQPEQPLLAVACLSDAHFNKLAVASESGADFNLDLAEAVWCNAVDDMMERLDRRRVERVILPLGNDLLHTNNAAGTTAKGTRVETAGTFQAMMEAACRACQYAVERLAEVAPVTVLYVPGNHDPETAYFVASYLQAYNRNHAGVTVDCSPPARKYVVHRQVLLGFTHGDTMKVSELPALMALETKRTGWADAAVTEWILGHVHTSRKWMTQDTHEEKGVTIRTVRSLAPTDSWHFKNGFVGAVRAAELLIYGPAHFDSSVSILARA